MHWHDLRREKGEEDIASPVAIISYYCLEESARSLAQSGYGAFG